MLLGEDKFEEFWRIYPRHTAKAVARKSWERMTLKLKVPADEILAGARKYAETQRGKDQQYIAHASTWLNQQRWTDEDPQQQGEPAPVARLPAYGAAVQASRLAHELRDKLIERTRHANWSRIEEAGRRCGVPGIEFWGCLMPDLLNRAWDHARDEAMGRDICPSVIDLDREDWLSAKLRVESRARHMRGMQQFSISPPIAKPMYRPHSQERRNDHDANIEDAGMARTEEEGARGLGCGNADERGRGEDHAAVGGQDWAGPAG